jgi:general secretion pathway protein E
MNEINAHEHRLNLSEVLEWMVADGLVAPEVAEALKVERRMHGVKVHPLVVIADQKWIAPGTPVRLLTLEALTEWLAGRVGLDYLHIDPLKIDFTGVAEVMSSAYAGRFGILPVQVTTREIVIATAEPFIREWVAELRPILRKDIRRVLANPDDISRYLVEFFNLAKSVKKAAAKGDVTSGLSSFEQLVELGKSNRQFDANDQHIVHIVDWLWQYAFDQRASDIHIEPRRTIGIVRFRIDGVLHQVYAIPAPVLIAMTSRIKLLARMEIVEKRRPQDGRIKTLAPDGKEVELRISISSPLGLRVLMRPSCGRRFSITSMRPSSLIRAVMALSTIIGI